ncbi:TonB-dependent hemoglobin/transferrin/lactoferrin family receptor [Marinicella sp. S1101]|uniref:TonB-dependent hemoglobin/transferrin/lactoferrin family receptor n=1 Tax=Marinicella marina TaxID=2996016 RepID=UPI0022610331|nr:TonB-dependent hemoglobin/transferrin/lactoferrin family receptor [Marinicella marina]MCX7552449.1 TonB-dependent hemoglobin/transferrin/lactoferrin family receptor [Marinicella marina]MDJ1139324.1 TonB-dependent hemoglobin/transferrin/lactoferrin family receptor [Marinicella marina]
MKNKVCFGIFMMLSGSVVAQEKPTTEEIENLDDLVVVAYKQPRPVQEVVGDVAVISAEQLTNTISQDMASAIKYEANIQIEDGGTRFGTSGVNVRGIGDNRVAIEVDGVPNAKSFDLGSYSFATATFPEIDLIQRIEVLNGPASTLYGSDALGGIVAINTWEPNLLLAEKAQGETNWNRLRVGFDGKRHSRFIGLTSAWGLDNHGLLLSVTQRDGKGVVNENSDLAKDVADWDRQSLFGKWSIATNTGNQLTFGLMANQKDQFTEINSFIGQGRFARTTALSGDDESSEQQLNFDYEFTVDGRYADDGRLLVYHANTDFEQHSFETRFSRRGTPLLQQRQFNFDSARTGLELNFTQSITSENSQHQLIYGFEFIHSEVQESRDASETNLLTGVVSQTVLGETFPLRDFPQTDVQELGLFIHDEITWADSPWTLVPALRFDHYDLSPKRDALFDNGAGDVPVVSIRASDFSPKLGLLYDINQSTNFYAQYVRGFRAPPYDDVNIGFRLALFNYQAIPNPDLKSETSDGLEFGLRHSGNQYDLSWHVFYNQYDDLIVSRDLIGLDPDTQALIFQSRNIEEASIYGAEMDYHWQINEQFSTAWQLAWTRGENDVTNQPLNSVSPPKATGSLAWQSVNGEWDATLYGVFSRAQERIDDPELELFKTPGFATFDLLVGHKLSPSSELRFGLFNLTNKKYWLWQQVRNFDNNDAIIEAMTQASRHLKISYSYQW